MPSFASAAKQSTLRLARPVDCFAASDDAALHGGISMRITQGCFSFLPDLTDEQIRAQVEYCLNNDWAVGVEYTDDPHPRNTYWNMWGHPMFDLRDAAGVMMELNACRQANPDAYIKLIAFDSTRGFETVRTSFIVQRPKVEPHFTMTRTEVRGRTVNVTLATAR
jgi:ribulose-bisphosphate carboxylase small chain